MRSDKLPNMSLNIGRLATTSLGLPRRHADTSASKQWSRQGAGLGPPRVRGKAVIDPFEIAGRLARLEELVERQIELRETTLQVGPLGLDLIERSARRAERSIDLLPREFLLLKYMMLHSGQLLDRGRLLQQVWHYRFIPKTNLVDVHMGRLRHKVDGPNETPMIHNIRGTGFILGAPPPDDSPARRSNYRNQRR
jgi:DNA-binding winged helix-turn-helix (wHTH) protein